MENLRKYLSEKKITQRKFADDLDVGQPTISKLLSGDSKPSLALAAKIQKITNGLVPHDCWGSEA